MVMRDVSCSLYIRGVIEAEFKTNNWEIEKCDVTQWQLHPFELFDDSISYFYTSGNIDINPNMSSNFGVLPVFV